MTSSVVFKNIINNLVKIDTNLFEDGEDPNKIEIIHKFFFKMLVYSDYKINQSAFFNETINNFYLSKNEEARESFIQLFCKINKTYVTLNRFAYIYKWKRAKIAVNTDLQLNIINKTDENIISIYHVGVKYLFRLEELLKIIYTSLTNNFSLISEPIPIKNPYNNLPFGKSILYYIYFFIMDKARLKFIKTEHIELFLKYKDCNFNTTLFVDNYDHILREYAINRYMNNSSKNILVYQINAILKMYNEKTHINKRIQIDEEFPEDELIRIMKPYLKLKLIANYSLIYKVRCHAKKRLDKKLAEFQQFNPQFGRKIVKFKNIYNNGRFKRVKSHIEFNMKHKKLNIVETDTFMKDHLGYIHNEYNMESDDDTNDDDNDTYGDDEMVDVVDPNILVANPIPNPNNYIIVHEGEEHYEANSDVGEDDDEDTIINGEDEEDDTDSIS